MFGKKLGASGRIAAGLALAGAALALAATSAQADPYSRYQNPSAGDNAYDSAYSDVGGVTVYAPRRYVRQPTTGAVVRLNSVSMTVPLGDLDLSTSYGAGVAKARIVQAARDVCDEADRAYPATSEVPGGCYATAVRQALQQAQDVAGYPITSWGYR